MTTTEIIRRALAHEIRNKTLTKDIAKELAVKVALEGNTEDAEWLDKLYRDCKKTIAQDLKVLNAMNRKEQKKEAIA